MFMEKGRFTLPGEAGMEQEIEELINKWGADAIRDSDGTELSDELLGLGVEVYSTLCLIRSDNKWLKSHPGYRQQIYLISESVIAVCDNTKIEIMKQYYPEQFQPNTDININKYWQVYDRTLGCALDGNAWSYENGLVIIRDAQLFHRYTVSFLAYQIWEPVSMYNHLTNHWDEEHKIPLDIRYPQAREHVLEVLEKWLTEHPKTDVVRFTTFFYNFDLIYNHLGKERQVNWFGYLGCVSPYALELFRKEYGYELQAEDFVDAGYYQTLFKNPGKKYIDWIDFNQRFVADCARQCVELVHRYGKKAIMFLGDHWAGTEPYGKYFQTIGLDAVVGAAGDGVTTRMIADIPIKETEARFYPYFFPDIFHDGGHPVNESVPVWLKCRRALLRNPVDRIGYGGYPSLAVKFPEFVEHVADIVSQFRSIHEKGGHTRPYQASFKVAILNTWGKIRSWQTHQVAHSLWNQSCYSYLGVMEALSGLPFEIVFISFEDIKMEGIPEEVGVIFNIGDANTSWSGSEYWKDTKIVTMIRNWVYMGGGFIGVGEPTACNYQGTYFQLEDVLGVQKEVGWTLSHNKMRKEIEKHFITEDLKNSPDYGEGMSMVYAVQEDTQVLDIKDGSCCLSAHAYGKGRAVYSAGAPYDAQNTRIILRSIFWTAHAEEEMFHWFSDNINVEVHAFEETGVLCVINNSELAQEATLYLGKGKPGRVRLAPLEMKWLCL